MATALFNPTSEILRAQHQGVDVVLAPHPESGHILKVGDARARHILNVLAPRGLSVLEYGDSDEKKKEKAESGRQRNRDFKRKQVISFNELNAANKGRKIPYLHPTKQLKEYADELGLELIQPYSAPDAGREKISGLMDEVEKKDTLIKEQSKETSELRSQVATLSDQVAALLKTFKPVEETEEPKHEEPKHEEVYKFRTLNKVQFNAWLKKNWDEFPTYAEEVMKEIDERYLKLFGEQLPASAPE